MSLRVGERVEGLTFLRPDGSAVAVEEFRGRPLLLLFLRHLA